MGFFAAFENVSVLFALILVGFYIGKKGLITEAGQKDITNLLVYVTMPSTIIGAMMRKITDDTISTILQLFVIIILAYVAMHFIALFVTRKFKLTPARQDVLMIASIMANCSFMGFPIILALFGQEILFYAAICQIFVFEFYIWTIGLNILERNVSETKSKYSIKHILTRPGIIAASIGLVIFVTQTTLPTPITKVLGFLGQATTPLAMTIVGVLLSRSKIKEALNNKYLYITSFLKLLVFPLMVYFVLLQFKVSQTVMIVSVVEFAMPTAATVAIFSDKSGNDGSLASEQVFLSSMISVITLPLIIMLVTK